jgi:peroxiredoxin family protein
MHLVPGPKAAPQAISRVSIIVSTGSPEGIYPALIMANGARMQGIVANRFFTFFGMDALHRERHDAITVETVGNLGLQLDIPPIPEFLEMVADSGRHLYDSKASVESRDLTAKN